MIEPLNGNFQTRTGKLNPNDIRNVFRNTIFNFNEEFVSDGVIGNFRQGDKAGDCYLLSALYSLSKTSNGAAIIKNNIKKEKDGSYTVMLPGAIIIKNDYAKNRKKCSITGVYKITSAEIKKARGSKKYSSGDIDVLLYELAFAKYRREVILTNNMNQQSSQYGIAGQYTGNATFFDPLKGGVGHDAMFVISGKQSSDYEVSANTVSSINSSSIKTIQSRKKKIDRRGVQRLLDKKAKNPGRYSITFGLKLDNGTGKDGYHALSVTRIENGRVYFVNPWDTKKEFSMTIDGFMKSAYQISFVDMETPSLTESVVEGAYNTYSNIISAIDNIIKK